MLCGNRSESLIPVFQREGVAFIAKHAAIQYNKEKDRSYVIMKTGAFRKNISKSYKHVVRIVMTG